MLLNFVATNISQILEQYDDNFIGAMDEVDIPGGSLLASDDLFRQAEEDFAKRRVNKSKPNRVEFPILPKM